MTPNFEPPAQRIQLVNQIMTGLRHRYASLNEIHYEAGWTDSWVHIRCFHKHSTLIDAAKCGMPQPGFYVLAVDGGSPRELTTEEDAIVNRFRFAGLNERREGLSLSHGLIHLAARRQPCSRRFGREYAPQSCTH